MLKTVIVGAGLMGRHHASVSARAGARVVAIVDSDDAAAKELVSKHRPAAAFRSLDEALGRLDVDVVHICTPSETHVELAQSIATSGAHALIEKPVGVTAEELQQIARAFEQAKSLFCPVHQYAFQRAFETAAGGTNDLGKLLRIDFDIRSAGGPEGTEGRDRTIADILPHPLSMIQRLYPGLDIGSLEWQLQRPAAGEWLCTAPIRDGSAASISLSLSARPTCFRSRLLYERGEIDIDHFNGYSRKLRGPTTRAYKILQPFHRNGQGLINAAANLGRRVVRHEWAYPGLLELVRLFYLSVATGDHSALPVLPEEALALAKTRDSLLAKARRIGEKGNH